MLLIDIIKKNGDEEGRRKERSSLVEKRKTNKTIFNFGCKSERRLYVFCVLVVQYNCAALLGQMFIMRSIFPVEFWELLATGLGQTVIRLVCRGTCLRL